MVYIIVGILTIISLVFTIYKKISHAAGSETNAIEFNPPPLLVGENIGPYSAYQRSLINSIVDDAINRSGLGNYSCLVLPYQNILWVAFMNDRSPEYSLSGFYVYYYKCYEYNLSGSYTREYSGGQLFIDVPLVYENINGVDYYKGTGQSVSYPVYIRNMDTYFFTSGSTVFTDHSISVGPDGHSKGGVLSNYIDSEDLLENSSDLPKIDTTPPADPSNTSGWLGKILNGIGKINQSIQGGVLTIGDYIGSGTETINNTITEVQNDVHNHYQWATEPFDKSQFENGVNSIPLISDLIACRTTIENSGMFDWSDVSPAQSVSFSFDFGGSVLPHTNTVIDFSWYTGTVKNICVAVLCTFLVLGLFVTIVNQIPSIIGGHSGDKGGGSDS